jgi:hypothetical protein
MQKRNALEVVIRRRDVGFSMLRNSYMTIVKATRRCCDVVDSFRDVVIDPAVESDAARERTLLPGSHF